MIEIKNYNLQSFTIGARHVRAFTLDNCCGIVSDYVLAECGKDGSPFTEDYYKKISFGEGVVKLRNEKDTAAYTVTRDAILLSQQTETIEDTIENTDIIIKQAEHIIPGTLAFMNNPKAKLLGFVWQFVEKDKTARERFKHPVAEELSKKLSKIELNTKEYPTEVNTRIVFRKKVSNSYLMKGQDDFLNIIITIGDCQVNDLWPDTEDTSRTVIQENTRIGTISFDIQMIYDPRRVITEKTIEAFGTECNRLKSRMSEMITGVGFDVE